MSSYSTFQKPPPGGDINRGTGLLVVIVVTFILAIFSICARFFIRARIVKSLGADDWTMLASVILFIITTAFNLQYLRSGGGRHLYYIGPSAAIEASKWSTIANFPFIWATALTKVSICLMVIRIVNSRRTTRFLAGMIAALAVVNLAVFIQLLAHCNPIEGLWTYSVHCSGRIVLQVFSFIQFVFSALTDLICTLLPILVLWKIQISWRQKFAIWALIGLGLFTTACSTVRAVLYATTTSFADSTFDLVTLQIWTTLEMSVGIIAGNAPALRPLYAVVGKGTLYSVSVMRGLFSRTQLASSEKTHGNAAFTRRQGRRSSRMVADSDDLHLPLQNLSNKTSTTVISARERL